MIQEALNRAVMSFAGIKKFHDIEKRQEALKSVQQQNVALKTQKLELEQQRLKLQKSRLNFQRKKYRESKQETNDQIVVGGQKVKMKDLPANLQKAIKEAK